MTNVAVIGGGLQGCCAALALARRGAQVHLFERESDLLQCASRWNEGKIHLGYIYANDGGDGTLARMLDGAQSFFPLLADLVGLRRDAITLSEPFTYLVARDSLLAPERIAAHFQRVDAAIDARREAGFDYLGAPIGPAATPLTPWFATRKVVRVIC